MLHLLQSKYDFGFAGRGTVFKSKSTVDGIYLVVTKKMVYCFLVKSFSRA